MFTITDTELLALLQQWLWPFLRVGGLLMAAPIIGTRTVPTRVRAILALLISIVLAPTLPPVAIIDPVSVAGIATVCQQIVIGVGMGLILRVMFAILEVAGQIVAQQMGLGFAALVDPQTGTQVPVLSQFYIVLATLFFLSVNGHLLTIEALARSFTLLPIGPQGLTPAGIGVVLEWSGALFSSAILIALPVVVALLVVNVALGVMARAAPQLNIFAVGFPIMLLIGVGVVLLSLTGLTTHFERLISAGFDTIERVLVER